METCICQFYISQEQNALQVGTKIAQCGRAFSSKYCFQKRSLVSKVLGFAYTALPKDTMVLCTGCAWFLNSLM